MKHTLWAQRRRRRGKQRLLVGVVVVAMPKKPGGGVGGDKRLAFFDAIRKQKLETVRWSLRYGGQQVHTRDDDNMTCLMVCAAEGKPRSLDEILEFLGRQNSRRGGSSRSEAGEAVDGLELTNDDGHTALMLAARAGKKECAALLVRYGARLETRNKSDGKTARAYCVDKNFRGMVEWFDRGCKDDASEEEQEEEDVDDPNAVEGESATQRSKRLRREKEAKEAGKSQRKQEVVEEKEEEDVVFIADADDRKEAFWPEVIKALASAETVQQTQKEVNCIKMDEATHKQVDPALWRCGFAYRLQLQMPKGVVTSIPHKIERFRQLDTLILSRNSLSSLPDEIKNCRNLRVLQLDGNEITQLPSAEVWSAITQLESVDLSSNKLTTDELAKMKGSLGSTLMSLKVDENQLTSLPLQWDSLKLIRHLSASSNKISELPDEIGLLRQMEFLNLEDNEIEDIPFGMADLSDKKFKEINFKGNPLADPRCTRILERERLPVKPLLAHLKKMAKQGGSKKKKKQQEKAKEPEPAAPSLSVSDMEQRITFVYEQKNLEKVGDVPKLMEKYKGKEAALYAAMLKKYEISDEDEFFASMTPPDEETPDEDEDEDEELQPTQEVAPEPAPEPAPVEAGTAPAVSASKPRKELSVSEIKERVTFVYEQKNPEKLKDMRKLMIKFRGREKLFYRAIKAKYKVNEAFFAEEFGDDDEMENDATVDVGAGDAGGDNGGEAENDSAEALAEAEAARAERTAALEAAVEAGEAIQWTPDTVKMRVMEMYAEKNPEKEADVPKLMEKYAGKEMALYTAICKKYGYTDKDFLGDDGEPVMKKVEETEDPAEKAKREKEAKEKKAAEEALAKSIEDGRKMDEDEKLSAQIEDLQNKARALKEKGKERYDALLLIYIFSLP